ncbi:MAG: glycosyltransferase, partial [candidate division Zixibacteria bacterium]|nr:glycosyltransferase [candidate division Zixibacteria bacterium]
TGGFLWPDFITVLLRSLDQESLDLIDLGLGDYELSSSADRYFARDSLCGYLKTIPDRQKETIMASLQNRYGHAVSNAKCTDYQPMSLDNLRLLAEDPLIIISPHSRSHPILSRLDEDRLEEEIVGSKKDVEAITGQEATQFAYPNGRLQDIGSLAFRITARNYAHAYTSEMGLVHPDQHQCMVSRIGIGRNTTDGQFRTLLSGIYLVPKKAVRYKSEQLWVNCLDTHSVRRKIRILQLVEDFGTVGGAERVVYNLISNLNPDEFDVSVALVGESELHLGLPATGVKMHILPRANGFSFTTLKHLISIIRENDIDIVHSHLMRMNTYNWIASRWCRIRSVASVHGIQVREASRKGKSFTHLAGLFSNRTVAVSEYLRRELIDVYGIKPAKVAVIHNAFDETRLAHRPDSDSIRAFREKHQVSPEGPIVAAVGHLREIKGYQFLFDAVERLTDTYPGIHLMIAGRDTRNEEPILKKLLQQRLQRAAVTFLGDFWDISTLLGAADVYVSSSLHEGFSIATVEAMASGLPVVVTDSGGPAEIVAHGHTGLVVPIADASALSEAIRKILDDHALARKFGENGRTETRRRFSMNRFVKKHEQLYRDLLRPGQGEDFKVRKK